MHEHFKKSFPATLTFQSLQLQLGLQLFQLVAIRVGPKNSSN
jgi:hypothetical protein